MPQKQSLFRTFFLSFLIVLKKGQKSCFKNNNENYMSIYSFFENSSSYIYIVWIYTQKDIFI